MAAARHLVIISYDVADDRDRARVADLLERPMTRVQGSVFEGWMSIAAGQAIAAEAAALTDAADSVRCYIVPRKSLADARAWGFPPAPCEEGVLIV